MSWRLSWLELHESFRRFRTTEFWIWNLRHYTWIERDESFWMIFHHLSCVLLGTCLSLIVFWSRMWSETMSTPGVQCVQYSDVEWVRCHVERGYGNLPPCGSTLWVRVKRHVIHHRGVWFMYRRCVEGYYKSSSFTHDADGREHSTCCRRNLCIWPTGWSQYSISLRTYHPLTFGDVIEQCWPECSVLISSTSYSGFCLSLVQLIAWAEDTYIGFTLRFCIVSSTLRSLFSPSDESAAINSWRGG